MENARGIRAARRELRAAKRDLRRIKQCPQRCSVPPSIRCDLLAGHDGDHRHRPLGQTEVVHYWR